MKTLQEIKDEVANKEGHADWLTLCFRENLTSINLLWEQVCKAYGEQCLREAAERVENDKEKILKLIEEMK